MSTASTISRRNFLRGRLMPAPEPIRPPWSTPASIAAHCEPCGKCIESCPEGIIAAGEDGYPQLSFSHRECTFCGACADACPRPVFAPRAEAPWRLKPVIAEGCLAVNAVWCRSCGDTCPERAIVFRVLNGGSAQILIDEHLCTGCGACVAVCPRSVVSIVEVAITERTVHG
jgi:ferredoxin-type protein NapF